VITYLPCGTKAIAVYDAALNWLTLAYKQNEYYYLIHKLLAGCSKQQQQQKHSCQ